MRCKRYYNYFNQTEEKPTGSEPCDIYLRYSSIDYWNVLLNKSEFENLTPMKLCSILNDAYMAGRKDAMTDLRSMIDGDAS